MTRQQKIEALEELLRDVTAFIREEGYTRVIRQIRKRMTAIREA
jgi:hypothetical protein